MSLLRWLPLLALSAACTSAGSHEVTVALDVAGTAVDPFENGDGWVIDLQRADVAFGPLYLCSGTQAGELCDTARADWIGTVVVDALDADPHLAGALEGTSGFVRSWMYDHGITSLLTKQQPVVLTAAETLGGSSIVVRGVARRDDVSVVFQASVPIQQEEGTERGVPVVRKSASDDFEHDLTGDERRLVVRFDPRAWLDGIDFEAGAETGELVLEPESQGFRAIRNAVVAGSRPAFVWE